MHSDTAQKILIIIHAPPYGSERCFSALRLALALAAHEQPKAEVKVFLMSDAVVAALPNQKDASGKTMQGMDDELVAAGVQVKLCQTCAWARGIGELPLIAGCSLGTLAGLAQDVLQADKVITL